ncbi:DoxX protein [Corynebacterium mustelae]|uniref:DoxX protein n=1 Tax=Corynebacterium mustelae TaxID=571915 RepID=A0A0G3GW93_9CORY|nr:DoxX protein [Corynebacterium mustelae]
MHMYRSIVRTLFAVIFISGGFSHLVLGRTHPESYAVFGDTALIPSLSNLWSDFVMPNIGWLTIVLGCYEVVAGVLLLMSRSKARLGAYMMLAFLGFITIVGYGFPTTSIVEDLLKNRIITIVMALLLIPVVLESSPKSWRAMWRHS